MGRIKGAKKIPEPAVLNAIHAEPVKIKFWKGTLVKRGSLKRYRFESPTPMDNGYAKKYNYGRAVAFFKKCTYKARRAMRDTSSLGLRHRRRIYTEGKAKSSLLF